MSIPESAVADHTFDPFYNAIAGERREIMEGALAQLNQIQNTIIKLKYFHNIPNIKMSYRKIGRELGYSHEYIRAQEKKGVLALREILSRYTPHDFAVEETVFPINRICLLPRERKRRILSPPLCQDEYKHMSPEQKKDRKRKVQLRWYLKNKKKIYARRKPFFAHYLKKRRDNLSNVYIKGLVAQGSVLKFSDIPSEIVETKRKQLQLIRAIRSRRRFNL